MVSKTESLFYNICENDYKRMLHCLNAKTAHFASNETIYSYGDQKPSVGIVESGQASVIRYEYNGTRTILEKLNAKEIFGANLAPHVEGSPSISVICDNRCEILFIDYTHILQPCAKVCSCHTQLIYNMLNLLSEKSRILSERIEVLSQRTIREKLLCYFMQLSSKSHSPTCRLPFTMTDFADFLSINRSAMARELSKMKEEGLLEFDKKTFTLHI